MSSDDRIPFNDRHPRTEPKFEIGEEALNEPGAFWTNPDSGSVDGGIDEHQPTKVLPVIDDDQPTQALYAAPVRRATDAESRRVQQPPASAPAQEPSAARELRGGGWLRLLLGGTIVLISSWLLLHGSGLMLGGAGFESLLTPTTLVGAPLLLVGILLLPGPAGGKVIGVVLAGLAYSAAIAPALLPAALGPLAAFMTTYMLAPACALLLLMAWLSVRGKSALAWLFVLVPPLLAVLMGAITGIGALLVGDPSAVLSESARALSLLPEPIASTMASWPDDIAAASVRFAAMAACVIPGVLLAWPFQGGSGRVQR